MRSIPQCYGVSILALFYFVIMYNGLNLITVTTYLSFCAKRQIQKADENTWHDYFLKVLLHG